LVTFTTTNLINSIKRNAHVPQGNSTFLPDDFLAIADMEMRTGIAPSIASCRENYWLTTQTLPIAEDNKYPIPSKALGSAIVDVKVKNGTNLIHLSRLEVSELYSLQYSTRPAYCYYIEDYNLKLIPQTLTGEVMMWYYRIPSQLVPVTSCGQITDITGLDVTVNAVPSNFITGGELDIVSQNPGFNVLLKDTEPVAITGDVITFADVPSNVKVGDYVCLSGQSCVVQCPLEWVEVLVQRATVRIYEIQGYDKKHVTAQRDLERMEKAALGLVSPRTIENAKIIPGGGSLLMPQTRGWKLPVR
jgi:hypothetical protein